MHAGVSFFFFQISNCFCFSRPEPSWKKSYHCHTSHARPRAPNQINPQPENREEKRRLGTSPASSHQPQPQVHPQPRIPPPLGAFLCFVVLFFSAFLLLRLVYLAALSSLSRGTSLLSLSLSLSLSYSLSLSCGVAVADHDHTRRSPCSQPLSLLLASYAATQHHERSSGPSLPRSALAPCSTEPYLTPQRAARRAAAAAQRRPPSRGAA